MRVFWYILKTIHALTNQDEVELRIDMAQNQCGLTQHSKLLEPLASTG